jgi:hypothetical protein
MGVDMVEHGKRQLRSKKNNIEEYRRKMEEW